MFRVSICHMQLATIGCTRAFFAIQCLLRIWEILGRSFLECCGHVEVPLFSVGIGSVERNRTEQSKKTIFFLILGLRGRSYLHISTGAGMLIYEISRLSMINCIFVDRTGCARLYIRMFGFTFAYSGVLAFYV